MKTTRTIKFARPRRFNPLGVSFFLLVALLAVSLFAGACDKHKKMADRHDEILRQEGD